MPKITITRVDGKNTKLVDGEQGCEWFAYCENKATHTVNHPILGQVPTCSSCIEKLDLHDKAEVIA